MLKMLKFLKSKKKISNDDLLRELHNINKSLNKICECIEFKSGYGGAIKTTPATRY